MPGEPRAVMLVAYLIAVTDAAVLSTKLDGTLLIVKAGATEKDAFERAKTLLGSVNATLLGVVLNNLKVNSRFGSGSYYYSYYSYYGGEKKRGKKKRAY